MNQSYTYRFLHALILSAGLVLASGGAGAFASQEKPGAGEGTQAKPSASGEKADAQKTAATTAAEPEPAQEPTWGPYQVVSSIEFGIRGIGIHGNGTPQAEAHE